MESKKFKQSKKRKIDNQSFAILLALIVSITMGIISILQNDSIVLFSVKLTISIIFFYILGAIIQKIYMSIISEHDKDEEQYKDEEQKEEEIE